MAITNYSDVEVKGNISSTKQGRLIGVLSAVPTTASGYTAGDTVLVNSTFYTLTGGSWVQTTLGNASQITVDSALSTTSTNPVQNKVIAALIPGEATSSNQLADKAFVNSSISTNTAEFKGNFNVVTDLGLTTSATTSQVATALNGRTFTPAATNNDYCFVYFDLSTDPGNVDRYERYKYNGSSWAYEYTLNNSSFTAEQWASINSGITTTLVTGLADAKTHANSAIQTISNGTGISATKSGTTYTIGHSNSVTATTSAIGGATAIPQIQYDAQGHIKANVTTATVYPPTDAGTNGQLWSSQGSGVGKWVNQSTVAAGSATNASYATAIGTSSSHPQIGSATQPVYVSSAGAVTAGTALAAGAYKAMGSVASGNTGLVTGGDVYTAVQNSSGFQITAESGYYTLSDGNNVSLTDHSTYWTMGWS